MRHAWWVFLKELRDALRDRRTLRAVLLSAVLPGPLMLGLISMQVDDMERHVESRELVVQGIDHAPSLRNFVERQGWAVREAPADFLRMIVVHELAHLRELDHNKPFYALCQHMEPDYFQLEFDLRLYLMHRDHPAGEVAS